MTRDDFQKLVDGVTGGEYHPPKRKSYTGRGQMLPTRELSVKWMCGGAWGGNCWDDAEPEAYIPKPQQEPEFKELDKILEKVCPNIGFLLYKELLALVEYDTYTEHEYYGNYTTYNTKRISVDTFWDFLKEKNLV